MSEQCKYTFKLVNTAETIEYNYNPLMKVDEFLKITKNRLQNTWKISNMYSLEIIESKYGEKGKAVRETNTLIIDKFGIFLCFYVRIVFRL